MLSWHEQNFVANWWPGIYWHWHIISRKFESWGRIVSVKSARHCYPTSPLSHWDNIIPCLQTISRQSAVNELQDNNTINTSSAVHIFIYIYIYASFKLIITVTADVRERTSVNLSVSRMLSKMSRAWCNHFFYLPDLQNYALFICLYRI